MRAARYFGCIPYPTVEVHIPQLLPDWLRLATLNLGKFMERSHIFAVRESIPGIHLHLQRQLVARLGVRLQVRSLHNRRLLPNLFSRSRKLELERPDKRKENCFHPENPVKHGNVKVNPENSLDDREAVPYASTRATEEGEGVAPHTWNGAGPCRYRLPALRFELVTILSPYAVVPVDRHDGDEQCLAFTDP